MEKKTLELIRCFETRRRAAPQLNALPDGSYEGQVSGFPGLINRNTALKETMEFLIPRWDDFSTDPSFPDTVSVWMWPLDDPRPADPFTTFTVSSPRQPVCRSILHWRGGHLAFTSCYTAYSLTTSVIPVNRYLSR